MSDKRSREWVCPHCGVSNIDSLPDALLPSTSNASSSADESSNTTGTTLSLSENSTMRSDEAGEADGSSAAAESESAMNAVQLVHLAAGCEDRDGLPPQQSEESLSASASSATATATGTASEDTSKLDSETSLQSLNLNRDSDGDGEVGEETAAGTGEEEGSNDESPGPRIQSSRLSLSPGGIAGSDAAPSSAPLNGTGNEGAEGGGVRRRGHGAAGASTSPAATTAQTDSSHRSPTPSPRAIMLLDGAIVVLVLWLGTLLGRKLL